MKLTVKEMPQLEYTVGENTEKELTVLIAAAGRSRRMGNDKILMNIIGEPVILHTLRVFEECENVKNIVIIANEDNVTEIQKICTDNGISKLTDIVLGGAERIDSVKNGLKKCYTEYVAIHDGARPLVKKQDIDRVFDAAVEYGGAIAGCPVKNTIKILNEDGLEVSTPTRNLLFEAHTPQIFKTEEYKMAIDIALQDKNTVYTDDAMIFTKAGKKVKTVDTGYENIKITTAEDVVFAQQIFLRRMGR